MNCYQSTLLVCLCFLLNACIPAPNAPVDLDLSLPPTMSMTEALPNQDTELEPQHSCDSSVDNQRQWTGVIYELKFGREEPPGISLGYNIDGRNSDGQDADSCYRSDLRSPEGEEGVDNQFAKIVPLIEAVGGEAIEGLTQGIINQGRLLMMFHLTALDDERLLEDDCIHLESFYGLGTPQIGTQGFLLSGQTFDRDTNRPATNSENLTLNEGAFEVRGLELDLPLEVFDQSYLFELDRVLIRGRFTPDGELHGFISGALDVEAVARRVEMIDGGGMVAELVPRFLRQQADLSPDQDGICRSLSMTLTFKAKRAFIYADDDALK